MAFLQDDIGTPADGGTIAFGANVAANSVLIALVGFADRTTSVVGITDTRGNTWSLVKRHAHASSAAGAEIWAARNSAAGTCTVTFDWSGASTPQTLIAEFSGFTTTATTDQTNGADFSGDPISAGNITPVETTNVCITCYRFTGSYGLTAYEDGFTGLTSASRRLGGYLLNGSGTFDGSIDMVASESGAAAIANIFDDTGGGGGGDAVPVCWAQYRARRH